MRLLKMTLGLGLAAGLAACGAMPGQAPFESLPPEGQMRAMPAAQAEARVTRAATSPIEERVPTQQQVQTEPMRLVNYSVRVPEALSVSEANLFYPVADIVWRGEPYGNRKAQIGAIFQTSLERARTLTDANTGARDVIAEITLNRFHSVTEKTRYTVGGVHSISFFMTLKDARTGETLVENRKVKADLTAMGGLRAKRAERQGKGMKVRIESHLARVLKAELTVPGGWADQGKTLSTAIDQI